MAVHPHVTVDLMDRGIRMRLEPRPKSPYWRILYHCRSIGVERVSQTEMYWTARYRSESMRYHRRRLGETDTFVKADGETHLSYEHAVERAWQWFSSPEVRSDAKPYYPTGATRSLNYCPVGGEFTVGHALKEFLDWKEMAAAESYFLTLVTLINYHLVPRVATVPVDELSGERLQDFVREILETPAKRGNRPQEPRRPIESYDSEERRKRRRTANTLLGIIRKSLEMAWENGRFENDRVFRRIRRLKHADRPRMLHLSRKECRALIKASPPDFRRLVLGALYTGCRRSELIRMRASHVGRDGYGVYVPPLKSSRARFVFLPDEGMAFFQELARGKQPDDFLFRQDRGTSWRYNMRYRFEKVKEKAGIPKGFTFHGLRHTYASQLIQAGAPLIVVADQLGHANSMQVMKTYGHLSPQIRESEVRQRFTSISSEYAAVAKKARPKLDRWRKSLSRGSWRNYATIHDLTSRERTNH